MLKIAITGPESTGKSTLTEALAQHFNCVFVSEYSREFLSNRRGEYSISDLDTIAQKQYDMMESAKDNTIVVCDTEMTVMKVWSEFKYGTCSDKILNLYQQQNFHHYFLCDTDIPWEDDPLREHPEKRQELLACYKKELQGKNYTLLSGKAEERLQRAIKLIEKLLNV